MYSDRKHRVTVNDDGNPNLPTDVAKQYGIQPGGELFLDEKDDGIFLRRPISHLAKVYIEPTSKCNLTCRTCIRNSWDEPMGQMASATFDRILTGIQELDSSPAIFLEVLANLFRTLHIVDMVAQAKEVSSKVELITNGILLTEERSRALHQAGLDFIWVSVDGAKPESYADIRIGAVLPEIFQNITRYRYLYFDMTGRDPGIGLAFVAMKRNIADLPELLKMSTRLGVSRYLVTNVLPYTLEMCEERLYDRSLDTLIGAPSPWAPGLDFPPMDTNQSTRDPLIRIMTAHPRYFQMDDSSSALRGYCPFIRQGSTTVAWDGNLSPCLALVHQYESYLKDIPRIVKRYVIGSVLEHSIKDLWMSVEYTDFRKRVDDFDFSPCTICGSCELAESNQEDCYGNTFPTCGGCLWAQGFIRCP